MQKFLIGLVIIVGLFIIVTLSTYGTLAPCQILQKELVRQGVTAGDNPVAARLLVRKRIQTCVDMGYCSQFNCLRYYLELKTKGLESTR